MQVAHHHTAHAVIGEGAEGVELQGIQSLAVVRDDGQVVVGIHIRIAVAGEMLRAGHDVDILHALHVGVRFHRYIGAVFPEGARMDDRVGCIVVDIGVRCEIHMYAGAGHLAAYFPAHAVDQVVVLDGPQHQLAWKAHGGLLHAHTEAPFPVNGYHQGQRAELLVAVDEFDLLFGRSLEETQGSDLEVLDQGFDLCHVVWPFVGMGANHEQLPDALVFRHGVEYRIYPGVFPGISTGDENKALLRMERNGRREDKQ